MGGAKIIWFTGLSGSGKTTLVNELFSYLGDKNQRVKIIDGDAVREKNEENRFTPEEITINNHKIIELCYNLQNKYDYLLVTVIAPFQKTRNKAKIKFTDNYIEVYVKADLETVIKRDTKGLYNRAKQGKLKNMIGLDTGVPYEEPVNPNLVIDTNSDNIEKSFSILLRKLEILGDVFLTTNLLTKKNKL